MPNSTSENRMYPRQTRNTVEMKPHERRSGPSMNLNANAGEALPKTREVVMHVNSANQTLHARKEQPVNKNQEKAYVTDTQRSPKSRNEACAGRADVPASLRSRFGQSRIVRALLRCWPSRRPGLVAEPRCPRRDIRQRSRLNRSPPGPMSSGLPSSPRPVPPPDLYYESTCCHRSAAGAQRMCRHRKMKKEQRKCPIQETRTRHSARDGRETAPCADSWKGSERCC